MERLKDAEKINEMKMFSSAGYITEYSWFSIHGYAVYGKEIEIFSSAGDITEYSWFSMHGYSALQLVTGASKCSQDGDGNIYRCIGYRSLRSLIVQECGRVFVYHCVIGIGIVKS
ncbi:MAG: hypothetical protein GY738_09425 [Pseudoalteromonas sp.]|nr:hypothetical protein [Pseudoalteromonas sp.]